VGCLRIAFRSHIVEAGLGGRWDATNVLQNTLAVLTLVDYDHTDILGNTLTQIATDKAGIVKPGGVRGRSPAACRSPGRVPECSGECSSARLPVW